MLLDQYGNAFSQRDLTPRASGQWIAVQESPARGQLQVGVPDTRRWMEPHEHKILLLKSRTLVANSGNAQGALNSITNMVGMLKPQARCEDVAWCKLAEARFAAVTGSPMMFDASGRHTFETAQAMLTELCARDGDVFTLLTRSEGGFPRFAFREAHECRTPWGGEGIRDWNNGVRTNRERFPVAYRFAEADGWGPEKEYTVSQRQIHHTARFKTLGQTRGTPALAHAINDLHDIMETKGFVKQAIKLAAMIGLTRRQDAPHGMTPSSLGVASPVTFEEPFAPQAGDESSGQTVQTDRVLTFEDLYAGGIISSVPLDTLHDERPHPNQGEFNNRILREIAAGIGLPHQLLYWMDDPGGAYSRIQLEACCRWTVREHADRLRPWCQRVWNYVIAVEMQSGRLPYPSKGEWWKVKWCPQRSMTADLGKMGKLMIELRKMLMTTYAAYYEELGMDYEEELSQTSLELKYIKELEKRDGHEPGELSAALSTQQGRQADQPAADPQKAAA